MQASTKARPETTDEESDLEEFTAIPPEDITVAIFCALSYESVAVKYSLDEEFECRPKGVGPRKYVYAFGRIGDHKIVIARPYQMGTVKAAQCAATVCQQFPNIRFALMVGIGAGIPSPPKRDIHLGDVVISIPRDGHPGVIEYDFGKYELDGEFVLKGSLNKPPPILIGADGALEEDEMMGRSRVRRILKTIAKQPGYARPNSGDILFDEAFHHVNKGKDCSVCEASERKKIVNRIERDKPGVPVVHRGLILSGGGVVKNPEDRDHLRRGYSEALCFEMEAAGIMDEIPCLVVRGICDYADTHKQDGWHNYAAAVAAAYGRAILLKINGEDVEETESMKETMKKFETKMTVMSNDIQDIKRTTIDGQRATEHKEVLDWLTRLDHSPEQSDHLSKRQPGTGEWLLHSARFKAWSEGNGQTLFCPGIPGAGKTILTSIVIDQLTAWRRADASIGITYFYCNYQRYSQQRLEDLLVCLLKQLVRDLSALPESIEVLHRSYKNSHRQPSIKEISEAFQSVARRHSRVFIVVDALDECQPTEGGRVSFLSTIFNLQAASRANIFLTSRFIPDITEMFKQSVPLEIKATKEDIQKYTEGYMEKLPSVIKKNHQLRVEIATEIAAVVDGMFLLAQIYLSSLDDKLTVAAVKKAIRQFQKQIPGSSENEKRKILDEAYRNAMKRICLQKKGFRQLAMNVLAWVTCAQRPLSTIELQVALAIEVGTCRLDIENIPQVEDMVSVCAGLIALDDASGIIRLVHYTTQEYLERNKEEWLPQAEANITNACITHLSFDVLDTGFCREDLQEGLQSNPLYDYAAKNWGHHARKAQNVSPEIMEFLKREDKLEAASQVLCYRHYYASTFTTRFSALHFAGYFGMQETAKVLLHQGKNPDLRDNLDRTPIAWAALNGYGLVANTLLEGGASVDSQDKDSGTPLIYAVINGDEAVVETLLKGGADVECRSKDGRTPLSYAAENGSEAVVKLLLRERARTDPKDKYGRAALTYAAIEGHHIVANLLLLHGDVNLESRDWEGRTALSWAAEKGHARIVKILLEGLAVIDSNDIYRQTPLSYATRIENQAAAKLLVEGGANLNSVDKDGRTPLSWAAGQGADLVVRLLLRKGAKLEPEDISGRTPLSWAARIGNEAIVKLLVESGANLESMDKDGRTPLSWAAGQGADLVVRLLLRKGAKLESQDISGQTPLSWAAENCRWEGVVVKTLLEKGANLHSKDKRGLTPISHIGAFIEGRAGSVIRELLLRSSTSELEDPEYKRQALFRASRHGSTAVLRRLIAEGTNLEQKAHSGSTPLSLAASYGHEAAVELLLKSGADIESRAGDSGTPLITAAQRGHDAVVATLLREGANIESPGPWNKTALCWAAWNGHVGTVKLLLASGAEVDSADNLYGRSALSYAAEQGYTAVVRELLRGGASIATPDKENGWYPFEHAAKKVHPGIGTRKEEYDWDNELDYGQDCQRVLRLLLEKGASGVSKSKGFNEKQLMVAAEHGYATVVEALLENRINVDATDSFGWTPLFYAIRQQNEVVVRLLLKKGADPNFALITGESPLFCAVEEGSEAILKCLLDNDAIVVDNEIPVKQTLLSRAAQAGHEAIFQLLLEKGMDPNLRDQDGRTALSYAAENGQDVIVSLLLNRGVKVDSKDSHGRTPLWWVMYGNKYYLEDLSRIELKGYETTVRLLLGKIMKLPITDAENGQLQLLTAVKYGLRDLVELLIVKGIDVNFKDAYGLTPLSLAAYEGYADIVSDLLRAKADPELPVGNGGTPLLLAVIEDRGLVVQRLLESGANINIKEEGDGDTALQLAYKKEYRDIVRLLLERGVNSPPYGIDYDQIQLLIAAQHGHRSLVERLLQRDTGNEARDGKYNELFIWTAKYGDLAIVRLLLQKNVYLECKDKRGRTPLSLTAQYGYTEIVRHLVKKGACVESECAEMKTPLSYAAMSGEEVIAKLLLDAGANQYSKDHLGRTPMDWAMENGHHAVVKLF